MTGEPPQLDIHRLLDTLDRHGVQYLVVGGVAAIAHGARRPTKDLDCLALRTADNFDRLGRALSELGARLRVEGLSDAEAAALPVHVDADTLGRLEISTWRTDAGDLDVLADLPDAQGHRLVYRDLVERADRQEFHGVAVQVAALDDIISSKEWSDRPKDRDALPELRRLAASAAEED